MAEEWSQAQLQSFVEDIARKTVKDELPAELRDPAKIAQVLRGSEVSEQTIQTVSTAVKAAMFVKGQEAARAPSARAAQVQRTLLMIGLFGKKTGFESGAKAAEAYEAHCRGENPGKKKYELDESIKKSLQASSFSAGGALIPENMSSELIELLRPATVVRRMGARVIDNPTGRLDIGRQNSGATSGWIGEGEAIVPSQPSFGRLVLTGKKLATFVPISNDLLNQVPMGMEDFVGNDMLLSHAVAEDSAYIRSLGTENKPTGIRYLVDQANNVIATAGTTLAQIDEDLTTAMYRVIDANVVGQRAGWLMHPRTFLYLMTLRDASGAGAGTGGYAFMDMLARGELLGAPIGLTTSIPKNLGGGTETELYYGLFDQLLIGETGEVRMESSNSAGYVQSATQHNAFQEDETVLRLIHKVDSKLRHNRAFSVVTGITWGAGLDS
jgi:HK97 family phage major capsid protein